MSVQVAKIGADAKKKRESSQDTETVSTSCISSSDDRIKRFRVRQERDLEGEDNRPLLPEEIQHPIVHTHWDLETALHRLVDDSNTPKELLAENFVSFRVGHSQDASAIATWYREMEDVKRAKSGDVLTTNEGAIGEKGRNDSLELWLEEGLGDEGTPPSIFALLADVHVKGQPEARQLGAVALLTLAWEHSQRLLRIEWFHVDPTMTDGDILGRRLWLRLSALALMTACQMMVVDSENVTNFHGTDEA